MFKKILTSFFLLAMTFVFSFVSANSETANTQYFYFHGQGCSHCFKVEEYFEKSKIDKKINISAYEIWKDSVGRDFFLSKLKEINYPVENS